MWAAGQNHAAVIRLLAAAGADLNVQSMVIDLPPVKSISPTMGYAMALPRGGMTALMYAAREGAPDAAVALAESGANLNLADPDGLTAMVLAIVNGHFDAWRRGWPRKVPTRTSATRWGWRRSTPLWTWCTRAICSIVRR